MKSTLIVIMAISGVFAAGQIKSVTPVVKPLQTRTVVEKIVKADTTITFKIDTVRTITYDTIRTIKTIKDTSIIIKTEIDTVKAKAKK